MLHSWSTNGLTHNEKHNIISDAVNSAICPCQITSDIPGDKFDAQLEQAVFGQTSVIRYSSIGAQKATRNRSHLDSQESDSVLLYLPITARFTIYQGNVTTHVDPGSLALIPLSKPLVGIFNSSINEIQTAVQIRLPSAPLRELQPHLSHLFNRRLSLNTGSGRVFQSLITSLIDEAAYIEDSSRSSMGQLITDSLSALCNAEMGRRQACSQLSERQQEDRAKVIEFIKAHLGNPDLSIEMVADHFSSSLRSIHRIFKNAGITVWGYIREQRLLNCQNELRNRELDHLSISQICFSWGFKDVAHFSRSYKSRFGYAPTQERVLRHR